jgi:hypothetical protein
VGLSVAAALVLGSGCVGGESSRLTNMRGSPTELVQSVLDAVEAKDEEALRGFLVSREEYETWLWPEMPDQEYTPFDFVWSINNTNNRKGLRQFLGEFGGLDLEVVSVTFDEDSEVYESFSLHPGANVVVRRNDSGQEGSLSSFDVLVEYGDGWKLMNYDEL